MIEQLFSNGMSLSAFPVRILYALTEDQDVPVKIAVTASSRTFKKAVHRNRIKRVLREAFRLQQNPLKEQLVADKKALAIFFIYLGKELPEYNDVYEKVTLLLQRLTRELINIKHNG